MPHRAAEPATFIQIIDPIAVGRHAAGRHAAVGRHAAIGFPPADRPALLDAISSPAFRAAALGLRAPAADAPAPGRTGDEDTAPAAPIRMAGIVRASALAASGGSILFGAAARALLVAPAPAEQPPVAPASAGSPEPATIEIDALDPGATVELSPETIAALIAEAPAETPGASSLAPASPGASATAPGPTATARDLASTWWSARLAPPPPSRSPSPLRAVLATCALLVPLLYALSLLARAIVHAR